MLILLLVLAIAALVVFVMLYLHECEETFAVLSFMSGVVMVGLIISICVLAPKVATASILDEKIAMYQEENERIEQNIDRIVSEYLKHEQNTFADLKTDESSITLVTLFPDLKSDTLVQEQLHIYVANNATIKSLKEEKIDIAKTRWILYFK